MSTLHLIIYDRKKSMKCNEEHIALSGFYHGATKTCLSMSVYKILNCNEKKIFSYEGATHTAKNRL